MTDLTTIFETLGIALGLGLLVGMQRERAASQVAGFRTFPLVVILGVIGAMLGETFGGWVVAAGFLGLAALIVAASQIKLRTPNADPGLTTEAALLVMYGVGAYLVVGHRSVAVVVGGTVAVLLYLKPELHALAKRIGEEDFRAIMQFVLISMVILPVLPNRAYGPLDVLNPQRIWWLVVLIVAFSLGGYVLYKLFGNRAGLVLAGLLGGLISSTATTVSYARRSKTSQGDGGLSALVIMLASTVVFARVLAIAAAVSREVFAAALVPLALMIVVCTALAGALWLRVPRHTLQMPPHDNPSELKSALVFGALFAVVLLATAAGKEYLGNGGLYAVAALSGLTDMDAITLSTAQMVKGGKIVEATAWRLILVAAMSNLVFKAGVVWVLGESGLVRRIGAVFGVAFGAGAALLAFWH
jgi:uncharacterized membrane protein (DUF4010 family)